MAATLLLSRGGREDGGREGGREEDCQELCIKGENRGGRAREREGGGAVKDVTVIYCLSPNSNCFISPAGMCLV